MFNYLIRREEIIDGWHFSLFDPTDNHEIGFVQYQREHNKNKFVYNNTHYNTNVFYYDTTLHRERGIIENDLREMFTMTPTNELNIIAIYIARTIGIDC